MPSGCVSVCDSRNGLPFVSARARHDLPLSPLAALRTSRLTPLSRLIGGGIFRRRSKGGTGFACSRRTHRAAHSKNRAGLGLCLEYCGRGLLPCYPLMCNFGIFRGDPEAEALRAPCCTPLIFSFPAALTSVAIQQLFQRLRHGRIQWHFSCSREFYLHFT